MLLGLLDKSFDVNSVSILQPEAHIVRKLQNEFTSNPEFHEQLNNPRLPYLVRNGILFVDEKLCVRKKFSENNCLTTTIRSHAVDIVERLWPEIESNTFTTVKPFELTWNNISRDVDPVKWPKRDTTSHLRSYTQFPLKENGKQFPWISILLYPRRRTGISVSWMSSVNGQK